MLNGLCLVLVACAAGGPGDWSDGGGGGGGGCGCSQGGGARPGVPGQAGYFGPRQPIFAGRLRGFFNRGPSNRPPYTLYEDPAYGVPGPGPGPAPWAQQAPPMTQAPPQAGYPEEQEPPLATELPPAQGVHANPSGEPTVVTVRRPDLRTATIKGLQVAKKYEDKIGHEDDYSWVTGHLFFVHTDGGRWVVRYGLPDQVDKFGGSVVLAPGADMQNYREGDLVCVYGRIVNEAPVAPSLGGALYRVNSINLVDRSDP